MNQHRLSDATWQAASGRTVVLVPVGSLEQHGPHLPLDTDTRIAEAVTEAVAARLHQAGVRVWVAPSLGYGSSGEHQSFSGTISLGSQVLHDSVVELVRSARSWAQRVVFVNGHGGNLAALTEAVSRLRSEGHDVLWLPCRTEGVDLHAGRTETSLMLHLRPQAVDVSRAEPGNTRALSEILPLMIEGGVAAVSANGVLGDPSGANAAEGAAVLDAMVDEVSAAILSEAVTV